MLAESSGCEPCKAELVIDGTRWNLKLEDTRQYEITLADIDRLDPASRKYVLKHIIIDD